MGVLQILGGLIQRALFLTTPSHIARSIDTLRTRLEELDKKLEREVESLQKQIEQAQSDLYPPRKP